MIFRLRRRTADTIEETFTDEDMYIILDNRREEGYRLSSTSRYWSSEERDKHGDLDFIIDLSSRVMKHIESYQLDEEFDIMDEQERESYLKQMFHSKGYFVEAGDGVTDKWFSYRIYEDLNELDNI